MDLLETILRSANAEQHVETFRKNNVEASTLPLLTEEDLKILEVDDLKTRKHILHKASTLQIPQEKKMDLTVTREYVDQVLSQISHQLVLHHASLSCALKRKDVVVCDVRLSNATQCLLDCLNNLEKELDEFQSKRKEKQLNQRRRILIMTGISTIGIIAVGALFKSLR